MKLRKKVELGAVAKAPTCEELEDVMGAVNRRALSVAVKHPAIFGTECNSNAPLFSFENPPIHQKAVLARAGIKPKQ